MNQRGVGMWEEEEKGRSTPWPFMSGCQLSWDILVCSGCFSFNFVFFGGGKVMVYLSNGTSKEPPVCPLLVMLGEAMCEFCRGSQGVG